MEDQNQILSLAKQASENAYAPYSKFKVGCTIISKNGNIYTGCNVENISLGLTNCAERTAVFKGVSAEGEAFQIERVVIFTPTNKPVTPCGACRQVLFEFGTDFEVSSFCISNQFITKNIRDLLPDTPDINL